MLLLWIQMALSQASTRDEIGTRLAYCPETADLARRLRSCQTGTCGKCGDICPIRAARSFRNNQPAIRQLLRADGAPVHRLQFSLTSWSKERGQLADTNIATIRKTLRRALDRLHEPSTRAIGMIDATWGGARWHIAAQLIICTPSEIEVLPAFDRAKNSIVFELEPAPSLGEELLSMFRKAYSAECIRGAANGYPAHHPNRLRREYYCWLAGVRPGGRIFRYGCDRSFRPVDKKMHWKPTTKKGRPWPRWLVPYQYGSHPDRCDCRICEGGRH
jgi:hypothetical protein